MYISKNCCCSTNATSWACSNLDDGDAVSDRDSMLTVPNTFTCASERGTGWSFNLMLEVASYLDSAQCKWSGHISVLYSQVHRGQINALETCYTPSALSVSLFNSLPLIYMVLLTYAMDEKKRIQRHRCKAKRRGHVANGANLLSSEAHVFLPFVSEHV